ncbi:hypothetical protein [Arthrobacter yangruifuii]|uniref:hypothetical protein n=1 Tax=Arthrobacter yangruifuii TaxID=2606616 RepID=UPI0011B41578|nr:hypothetical protein [Arthrobacter yangruifuii]
MDERQNVYGRWDAATAGTAEDPTAALVTLHIDENLRNTKRITQTFRGFAGQHFSPHGGDGLPVRSVACTTEDALDVARDCVDALIDEGWAANQIPLPTTNRQQPIHQDYCDAQRIPEYLYVGLSRARCLLVVVGTTALPLRPHPPVRRAVDKAARLTQTTPYSGCLPL